MEDKHQDRRGVASAGAVMFLLIAGMMLLGEVLQPDDGPAAGRSEPTRAATRSTSTFAPVMSTARRAAIADGITDPDASDIARYSRLLTDGVEACGEPESRVLREVEAAQMLLAQKGIRESRATILGQLRGTGEFGVDCLTLLATYVTLRNG